EEGRTTRCTLLPSQSPSRYGTARWAFSQKCTSRALHSLANPYEPTADRQMSDRRSDTYRKTTLKQGSCSGSTSRAPPRPSRTTRATRSVTVDASDHDPHRADQASNRTLESHHQER